MVLKSKWRSHLAMWSRGNSVSSSGRWHLMVPCLMRRAYRMQATTSIWKITTIFWISQTQSSRSCSRSKRDLIFFPSMACRRFTSSNSKSGAALLTSTSCSISLCIKHLMLWASSARNSHSLRPSVWGHTPIMWRHLLTRKLVAMLKSLHFRGKTIIHKL